MAERQQTGEARVYLCAFRDSNGVPKTGLTPSATAVYKDGSSGAPAIAVAEVGLGFYRLTPASAATKDMGISVDGGAALTSTRYALLEVPVGGYVDQVDAATSSRATSASITALGSPAQTSDARFANLDAKVSGTATSAQLGAATSPLATSTSVLALLTAVQALGTPAQASTLSALATALGSPAQAAALASALSSLSDLILTRATKADVNVTVTPTPQLGGSLT